MAVPCMMQTVRKYFENRSCTDCTLWINRVFEGGWASCFEFFIRINRAATESFLYDTFSEFGVISLGWASRSRINAWKRLTFFQAVIMFCRSAFQDGFNPWTLSTDRLPTVGKSPSTLLTLQVKSVLSWRIATRANIFRRVCQPRVFPLLWLRPP